MAVTKIDLVNQVTGLLPATSVPNPSASTLGGIQSTVGAANSFVSSISTSGVPALTQPSFTNISSTLLAAQMVALTGDTTNTIGTAATTNKGMNGVLFSSLVTGLIKNTTGTGVPSIAVAGTDYLAPAGSSAALSQATTGAFGVVKPDGSTITISAGVITAVGTTINFVDNEVVTGTINSVNATFTLAFTPLTGALSLFLNGTLQQSGTGNDYTLSGLTITMLNVPQTGDKLLANYRR